MVRSAGLFFEFKIHTPITLDNPDPNYTSFS